MRTAAACLGFLIAALTSAGILTEDFKAWTSEGARRLSVERRPVDLPAAHLTHSDGRNASMPALWQAGARVWIVDFIYTRCPSLCLAMGTQYQQLQRGIASQGLVGRVGLLSVSFDLQYDDPAALKDYEQRMRADPAIWQVVVPDDAASLNALLQSFEVTVIADLNQGFQHNGALHVVDAAGRLLKIFEYSEAAAALTFARTLVDADS